jgi:hypothetical protein
MNRGYVKVWRKIEDSGLIQLPNTLALFMHILLNATHKDRKVGTPNGVIELKRGQYISGRIELASRLKQSEQQIRTSLKRLEDLQIISIISTNRYSIYTIENYNIYQDSDQQDNQQITNKQPTDNQQITTKQELNNLNTEELNKDITPLASLIALGVSKKSAQDWLKIRKLKKLILNDDALELFKREIAKANITASEAIKICNQKSWGGFKADWLKDEKPNELKTPDWAKDLI